MLFDKISAASGTTSLEHQSKKAIDHVDVARNKRQAAFDRADHVEFSFGNRGPYAAVLGEEERRRPNRHRELGSQSVVRDGQQRAALIGSPKAEHLAKI